MQYEFKHKTLIVEQKRMHTNSISLTRELAVLTEIIDECFYLRDSLDISFGILLVEHNIKKTYFFETRYHNSIQFLFSKINTAMNNKYNFVVENGFISKTAINTTNKSRDEILEHIHPNWKTDTRLNCKTMLLLDVMLGCSRLYQECAGLTYTNKEHMKQLLKKLTDFTKNITYKTQNVRFSLDTLENSLYIKNKMIKMFEISDLFDLYGNSVLLSFKPDIMNVIQNNKDKIIQFLVTQTLYDQSAKPDYEFYEHHQKFKTFSLADWKQLFYSFET